MWSNLKKKKKGLKQKQDYSFNYSIGAHENVNTS